MEQTFQFVDITQVDKTTRKLIRSHVMKGKNAGRTIHRPSRLDMARRLPKSKPFRCLAQTPKEDAIASVWRKSCLETVERRLGSPFLTVRFPVDITSHILEVIGRFFTFVAEKMYPAHLGLSPDRAMSAWFHVLLADEAAIHCGVELMEACNGLFLGAECSSQGALRHLSRAFSFVNRRLESDEALSDSTLGLVLMLIMQEQIRKGRLEAEIHYEGLRKLIELRGGLEQLQGNMALLLKICKVDMTYCLQQGRPMRFYRDRMSDVHRRLAALGLRLDQTAAISAIRHTGLLDPALYGVLVDATSISDLINTLPAGTTMDAMTFQEMLVSVLSRLIRFSPFHAHPDGASGSNTEAAYHVGLTIFAMTLFLQYDGRRAVGYERVFARLGDVLDRRASGVDDDLLLWVMLLGGVWVSHGGSWAWLASKMAGLARRLELRSWEEVRVLVSRYPWIYRLHDALGSAVWRRVCDRDLAGLGP